MGLTHDMLATVQYLLCFAPMTAAWRVRLERIEGYLLRRYSRR